MVYRGKHGFNSTNLSGNKERHLLDGIQPHYINKGECPRCHELVHTARGRLLIHVKKHRREENISFTEGKEIIESVRADGRRRVSEYKRVCNERAIENSKPKKFGQQYLEKK